MVSELPGGDQSALRHLNTRRVLQLLYSGPAMTVTAVANATELSRPTVQAILTSLVDSELLRLDGHDAAKRGGRPAQRYRFNSDAGLVAGIDIGAHTIAVRIATLGGTLVAAVRRAVPADAGHATRVDLAIDVLTSAVPAGSGPLWAATVGTPGIVDEHGVVRLCVAIPEWTGVALAEEIGSRLGCPTTAMKDTNLAVLAEHRVGAAQNVPDALYVHVGHRLGVGLLVDGVPFTGRSGSAGEVGKHPAFGWEEAPGRLAADAGLSDAGSEEASERIFARARQGDSLPLAAVDTFAKTLAGGIGAMVLAMDPRLIVVGGGLARAGAVIVDPIRKHLSDICYDVPPLALSALGEDAVAIGALEAARDQVRDLLVTKADSAAS